MTIPVPSGRLVPREDGKPGADALFTRAFPLSLDELWSFATESEKLERWIGSWSGDPASGKIDFLMTAEGATEPSDVTIEHCEKNSGYELAIAQGDGGWKLGVRLHEADALSVFTLAHHFDAIGELGSYGPGWEYYLDRLAAVINGEDVAAIDFNDYYPAQSAYFEKLEAELP